uniref:Uncharacterized protein n=1 Tax=Babesia bovis TaxID=5865 RepID=A7ATQ6_BABBO|eukprot:XP_001609885.1 hypothetical protein [Babesia bovis T2Bo]
MYPPKNKVSTDTTASRFRKTFLKFTSPSSATVETTSSPLTGSKSMPTKGKKMDGSVTVVPAGDNEVCAAIEPSAIYEDGDESSTISNMKGSVIDINKYDSLDIHGCTTTTDEYGSDYSHPRVESVSHNSGNFLQTLKTLVDITSVANVDDLQSLSGFTSGTESEDADDYSLVTPIKEATYTIIRTSSQFIKNVSEDNKYFSGNKNNQTTIKHVDSLKHAMGRTTSGTLVSMESYTADQSLESSNTWNFSDVSKWL